MKADKNAPKKVVKQADITAAARAVGIVPGDVMFFHSSLSSMGYVAGGADAVINGFLAAVAPGGTVAVPTLCNWTAETQARVYPDWDPATSPSYVGKITEVFRRRPDARRSDQATHSIAASGSRAAELTAAHTASGPRPSPFGDRAFCASSPWQKLYDWNAAYCFLGVTFRVCTLVHFVESLLVERTLAAAPAADRANLAADIAGWMKPGVSLSIRIDRRVEFEAYLARHERARYASVGAATLCMARSRDIVDEWLALVEADPQAWLTDTALAWFRRARA